MKKILFIASAIFILAACKSKEKGATEKGKINEIKLEGLQGNIMSFEETPYKTDSAGKIGEMDSCCIGISEIDENGNYIKWTEKDSKGTVKNQSEFARYEDGYWKGQKSTREGKPSGSMDTKRDDKGQYTWAAQYDSTGKLDRYYTGITQNESGQVLTWKEYDKDSVFRQEGISVYEKNLQTSFTMKDSTGKVKSSFTYKYNDKSEQTEVSNTTITKDTTKTELTKYTYESHDDTGNWTQRTSWNDKGKATKITKRVYNYRKDEVKK